MKKISSLFIVILVCISITLNAQQQENLTFEVIHSDKPLGELKAVKVIKDGKTTYTDNTSIVAHIFTKIDVEYKYECVYMDNQLFDSNVLMTVNGHVKTKTSTTENNSVYTFYKDDEKKNTIKKSITFSSVRLLFEEPINITEVYAEEHGMFHPLTKTGDHTYVKSNPEGHKNTYYYKNGNLQKSEIHSGMISFSMERKDN